MNTRPREKIHHDHETGGWQTYKIIKIVYRHQILELSVLSQGNLQAALANVGRPKNFAWWEEFQNAFLAIRKW